MSCSKQCKICDQLSKYNERSIIIMREMENGLKDDINYVKNTNSKRQMIFSVNKRGIVSATPSSNPVKNMGVQEFEDMWKHFAKQTQESFIQALNYSSKNPIVTILMSQSNVCYGFKMILPYSFAIPHMPEDDTEYTLMDSNKKTWKVRWLGRHRAFSAGWRHFAVDHKLMTADISIFEKLDDYKMMVHIFRVSDSDRDMLKDTIPRNICENLRSSKTKLTATVQATD